MNTDAPLQVTAGSRVASASIVWRQGSAWWATIVVKTTFRLVHDGFAEVVEPLDVVTADRCRTTGSLEFASETAPYLPEVGVLLSGHAYAPAGRQVTSASVRIGLVGGTGRPLIDKTLHVYGDRAPAGGREARPFAKMPLVYERACGCPDNPAGVPPGSSALPNVIDPVDPSRPGSFGPIASHWPARRALLGGLNPAMIEVPVPKVPVHFDWRYFQAAAADQRVDALRGGEWIVLDGMNPALARMQTRLPEMTARAEWRAATVLGAGRVHPVDLYADMLVIDADRLLCSVVWRGRFTIERLDTLEDIRVSVELEPTAARRAPAPQPTPAPTSVSRSVLASLAATSDLDPRAVVRQVLPFRPTGHDLAGTLPLGEVIVHEERDRPPLPLARTAPDAGTARTSQVAVPVRARPPVEALAATLGPGDANPLRPAFPFAPADPAHSAIAGTPNAHPAGSLRDTVALDPGAVGKPSLPFTAREAPPPFPEQLEQRALPLRAEPPPQDTREVAATFREQRVPPSPAPPAAMTSSPRLDEPTQGTGVREQVIARLQARRLIHGLDLVGADLSALDLSGALLSGLDLRRANLRGANMTRARLVGVQLEGADLTDAVLAGADLSRANLSGALLERVDLGGAILVGANLEGADLRDARLPNR